MAWIRCSGNMGGRTELKTATGSVAVFNTNLPAPVIDAKSDIGYSAKGYRSATIINTSNTPARDNKPYLFRPSFSNGYGYETLIGGTCGVNQLANTLTSNDWLNESGVSSSYSDGVCTFSSTTANNGIKTPITILSGHKYLLSVYFNTPSALTVFFGGTTGSSVEQAISDTDTWVHVSSIVSPSSNYGTLFAFARSVYTDLKMKNPMVIDLTQMFGTTIADYVYTLESGTSGAGITWLNNNGFFNEDYYPYDAGSLLSVKTTKKINKDSSNNVIGEYTLDDVDLSGILMLDADNKLYYNGDIYSSSGEVVRKYGIVDLGSVNWLRATSSGTVNYFYIQNSELPSLNIKEESYPTSLNIVCPIYITKSNNNSIATALNSDMTMCRNQTNICIRNDTYSTPEAFKTAMSGVYLVYELATPTTETADPFTNPMLVDGNGTEEFVDGRTVEMPVGHETIYGEDMKARTTDFGVTVYGGSIDFTSGTLISDKNADGTDKTPETISVTPVALETRKGSNNICSDTNGNSTIKYVDYGT